MSESDHQDYVRGNVLGWLDEVLIRTGHYSSIFVEELVTHDINRTIDVHDVFDQIGRLEDPSFPRGGGVKPATPFTGKLLSGLWHQHYSSAYHPLKNLQIDFRSVEAQAILQKMADTINNGNDPSRFIHELVMGGYERRFSACEMTGQWIVFAKSPLGRNYYLTLGEHPTTSGRREGDAAILERVRRCSEEFPELLTLIPSLSIPQPTPPT
jgi:hypothetical protein